MNPELLNKAVNILKTSKRTFAFTGAGISVESGVPPFRGEMGLWNRYDPMVLEIGYFYANPLESWKVIREIFYDFFRDAKPNRAHEVLAVMEARGLLSSVVTQNIDNLHQAAGSRAVYEYHGNARQLVCTQCQALYSPDETDLDNLPPLCPIDGAVLKPDFVFFGEMIPEYASMMAMMEARSAEAVLVIGSTGEVMPACYIPRLAKENGAIVIEVNPGTSLFTPRVTDIHLQGPAAEVMDAIATRLFA